MSSVGIQITSGVAIVLEGATLSLPFAVTRAYIDIEQREVLESDGIQLTVTPGELEVVFFDLKPRHSFNWEVLIQCDAKVDGSVAMIDPLVNLMEEVIDLFRVAPLEGTNYRCIGIHLDHYDREMLDTLRIFSTVLSLTFKANR